MRLIFFIVVLALAFIQCKDFASPTIEVICHPGICEDTIEQDPEAEKILEDANIDLKGNDLNKIDSQNVEDELTIRTNKSELNGKSYEEIFDMYSTFLSKYNKNNKIDIVHNHHWNNDPFFQAMYKDT
jgi:hypothetical protein